MTFAAPAPELALLPELAELGLDALAEAELPEPEPAEEPALAELADEPAELADEPAELAELADEAELPEPAELALPELTELLDPPPAAEEDAGLLPHAASTRPAAQSTPRARIVPFVMVASLGSTERFPAGEGAPAPSRCRRSRDQTVESCTGNKVPEVLHSRPAPTANRRSRNTIVARL